MIVSRGTSSFQPITCSSIPKQTPTSPSNSRSIKRAHQSTIPPDDWPVNSCEGKGPSATPRYEILLARCADCKKVNRHFDQVDQMPSYAPPHGVTNRQATLQSSCPRSHATISRAPPRLQATPTLETGQDDVCFGSFPSTNTTADSCHTTRRARTPPPSPRTRCMPRTTSRT